MQFASIASFVSGVLVVTVAPAKADITRYTNAAKWQSAVGNNYQTIDFTGNEHFTLIGDAYADEFGVTFTDNSYFWGPTPGFSNDDWGVYGPDGSWFTFDRPQQWIGFDFPGALWVELYYEGELVYETPPGQQLLGEQFGGFVSTQPFDTIYLFRPDPYPNVIGIDDLHFGVPAPGALGLLFVAGLVGPTRRRS